MVTKVERTVIVFVADMVRADINHIILSKKEENKMEKSVVVVDTFLQRW
jgi:hypothetical protein